MYDVTPVTSPGQADCGPTCLKMLLAFYGQDVDLDALTRECKPRLIGCSGADLLRAGRAHGLDMRAYQMSAEELLRQDRPAIIWWIKNHWCVFCGQDGQGRAMICNPDRGRFGLDQGTFKALYSGIALFNGEPANLPEPAASEESDLAQAGRILLGVDV